MDALSEVLKVVSSVARSFTTRSSQLRGVFVRPTRAGWRRPTSINHPGTPSFIACSSKAKPTREFRHCHHKRGYYLVCYLVLWLSPRQRFAITEEAASGATVGQGCSPYDSGSTLGDWATTSAAHVGHD